MKLVIIESSLLLINERRVKLREGLLRLSSGRGLVALEDYVIVLRGERVLPGLVEESVVVIFTFF